MKHKRKKIISIVGARPQFIKIAPLSHQLLKFYDSKIIHTGQHYDKTMSESFFRELNINEPDYNLDIHGGSHGEQTGRMLIHLEKILLEEHPDLLIIFGDTNSTLSGAIVGSKLHIPILHIEAGLRSYNKRMPEEINRIVADHISDILFAPTLTAVNNLYNEGLKDNTYLTGDIMVDSLKNYITIAKGKKSIINNLNLNDEYYLLTLHRPYNVDDPERLNHILSRISDLNVLVIFPVHPRTLNVIKNNKLKINSNIKMIEPVGYLDFLCLELGAKKILTDSGGIQKEAYILQKPCLTIRSETEWVETIQEGWNQLVDPGDENFVDKIISFQPIKRQRYIFGENVSKKMIDTIDTIL